MSELTTVARPYAKAAFDFAIEKGVVAKWQEMLTFAGAVAANDEMQTHLPTFLIMCAVSNSMNMVKT